MAIKVDFHYGMDPSFGPDDHETVGVGGTENFITYSSEYLARAGHIVRVFNKIPSAAYSNAGIPGAALGHKVPKRSEGHKTPWLPLGRFNPSEDRDVLVSFRTREIFAERPNARLKVLILADTESLGLGDAVRGGEIDLVMFVGQWQAEKIGAEEGIPGENRMITSNGVALESFDELRAQVERQSGKCIHLATPERGLEPLLDIWPAIQERVPDATLHLYSSFIGWKVTPDQNEEMCRGIYDRIERMQADGFRIVNHKHASAWEIRRALLESQVYLYPTRHFNETCCISCIEASAAGVPIVATDRAALRERVKDCMTGYLVSDGKSHDRLFAQFAIRLLFDRDTWTHFSTFSEGMARRFDYAQLVEDWVERWEHEIALRG